MPRKTASAIYGNLDLLILHTVKEQRSCHGLGIIDAIEASSDGFVQIEDGALYRALHRLEEHGLLQAEWRISEKNRKAKFYGLTPSGEEELTRAQIEWTRHTNAIGKILGVELETGS